MSPASRSDRRAAEASAACRIDLFGGAFGLVPLRARPQGATSIAVALDRRPYAQVETGHEGLRLESKDSLLKLDVARVEDLPPTGLPGLVRGVLLELGVVEGLLVRVQSRVPFEAGLGSAGALAVALAAAVARVRRVAPSSESLAAFGAHGEMFEPGLPALGLAAVRGGIVAAPAGPLPGRGEPLPVDPARIEECLLLVDVASGSVGSPVSAESAEALAQEGLVPGRVALPAGVAVGDEAALVVERGREALLARRYGDLPDLLTADLEAWRAALRGLPSSFGRLEAVVRDAGGVVRPGPGPRSLAMVWAAPGERGPGPRERVIRALQGASYRTFPCRVDLRGLEVEDA